MISLIFIRNAFSLFLFQTSTCLASCVECLWVSNSQKTHLKESLWLYCGGYGMRVWLPVFPRDADSGYGSRHTFMSKRIMLSFALKLYPLAILFEDAIILGVENDTVVYTSDSSSHFSLPFCILERAVSNRFSVQNVRDTAFYNFNSFFNRVKCIFIKFYVNWYGEISATMHGRLHVAAPTYRIFRIHLSFCCMRCLKKRRLARNRLPMLYFQVYWNSFKNFQFIYR